MACLALVRTDLREGTRLSTTTKASGYDPADLQSAYGLTSASATRGGGQVVAVVDAYNDPKAAADLAVYRHRWGLPACDPHTGAGCVRVVNQDGKPGPLPSADPYGSWEVETSLDLDMVSAACPRCRLLLVEARTPFSQDLGAAENSAVRLGARFVSDSWGGGGDPSLNHYFDHPGVAIAAAGGDFSSAGTYPAGSQLVTSVGGTTLTRAADISRGWSEKAWDLTGSGCTQLPVLDAQPPWQQADLRIRWGCPNRVQNDVSAVADPHTPVWAYDSYPFHGQPPGWTGVGGTSVAAPLIAGVYALAGTPRPGSYPASYPYQPGHAAMLNDITAGSTGTCIPAFLCHAQPGYDGPSGWGTPHGTAAFADSRTGEAVTVLDPGTRDYPVGAAVELSVRAVSTARVPVLRYTATGLPAGLSISASTGIISGRLPATAGTSNVTVTAVGSGGGRGSVSFRIVAVPDLRTGYHPVTGPVLQHLGLGSGPYHGPVVCLDDAGGRSKDGTKVQLWKCDGRTASQDWTFMPDAHPDGSGTLTIHGKCLTINGKLANNAKVVLSRCSGAAGQVWSLEYGAAWLYNPASGMCLTDPSPSGRNGTPAEIRTCVSNWPDYFALLPGPVMSAGTGTCLTDPGNSTTSGTRLQARPCDGTAAQKWGDFSNYLNSSPTGHGNLCLSAGSGLPGASIEIRGCLSDPWILWFPEPDGEILNANAGLCLDNPHPGARDTKLKLANCSGQPGELWAVG